MTFLKQIQAHKCGLIRLKTGLYWYDRGYDGHPGRICLVLDAAEDVRADAATPTVATAAWRTADHTITSACRQAAPTPKSGSRPRLELQRAGGTAG